MLAADRVSVNTNDLDAGLRQTDKARGVLPAKSACIFVHPAIKKALCGWAGRRQGTLAVESAALVGA